MDIFVAPNRIENRACEQGIKVSLNHISCGQRQFYLEPVKRFGFGDPNQVHTE
jgi:hypothetical protein